MKFKANILDYLGKYEDGILVLLTIEYNNSYYDATYFYNKEHLLLTVSDDLDTLLENDITSYPEYPDLIRSLIKATIPYDEIINRLDFFENKKSEI